MSLLQQFKPSPLVESPLAFYDILDPETIRMRQVQLYQGTLKALKSGNMDAVKEIWDTLKWYQRIVQYLLIATEVPSEVKCDWALECPNAGFQAVVSDYGSNAAKILELSLLSKPEYICKLLLWAHEQKQELRYSPQVYNTVLFTEFYWSHYYYTRRPEEFFFEKFVKFHLENKDISPNSMLTLLCLDNITPNDEIQTQLMLDPAVAVQTALIFPDLFDAEALLFDAALMPKWAFHILSFMKKPPENISNVCLETLKWSPPWYLEYLVKSGQWALPAGKQALSAVLEKSTHPLKADFESLLLKSK